MDKLYTKVGWKNEPDKTTPINETNLGKMDNGINGLDNRVIELDNNKVDKVAGKGLSTNDYTDTEKQKLNGIEAGAQVNSVTGVKGDGETPYRTGNVNITKGNIGLGNVDNTSDANKPISTATQTALNTIASAFKKSRLWNESGLGTPISEYGFGTPTTATGEDREKQYLDLATGFVYTCVQQGADYYVWRQADTRPPLEINEIGKAISKIWDLGAYSRTTLKYSFGNPTGMYDGAKEGSNAYVLDVLNGIVYKNTRMGQSSWTWIPQANLSLITNAISEELTNSKTASGSMITLTDASNTNLIECVATISSSTSSVTITVKDTSTNPTVTNTYTIDLGQTVSSGTLDVVKGMLTTGGTIYNLPPTQIKLLKGNNVISSNVSSLSIKYQPDNVLGTLKADIESEYDHLISKITPRTAKVYSFHISNSESDPSSKVTYLDDAVGMTPAKMNYSTGKFDYGSWKDIWFVKECKPCILAQAGYVMKYLDPNDYTKDIDGNTVAIDGGLVGANVMIEFPKIWYKVVPDYGDENSASVYISPVKVDEGYKDYAYIDYQGHHKEHFYMPAYNGSLIDDVMRSLSGQQVSKAKTGQQEIDYCKANGDGWYTEDVGEIMLINFLLILMGKSTDTQTVFGQGLHTGGTEAINNNFRTGVHNTKGLFYGTNSGAISDGNYANAVKVFGMENYWGFQWRRYAGDMLVNGVRKIKLCYGNEDGSSTFAFNGTGEGYVNINEQPSGTSGGYISKMKFTHDGMYSEVSSGSSSTNYCDGQWFNNSYPTIYAFRGGTSNAGLLVGALCVVLNSTFGGAGWSIGAAPSWK